MFKVIQQWLEENRYIWVFILTLFESRGLPKLLNFSMSKTPCRIKAEMKDLCRSQRVAKTKHLIYSRDTASDIPKCRWALPLKCKVLKWRRKGMKNISVKMHLNVKIALQRSGRQCLMATDEALGSGWYHSKIFFHSVSLKTFQEATCIPLCSVLQRNWWGQNKMLACSHQKEI